MEAAEDRPIVAVVVGPECNDCPATLELVDELVAQNHETGVDIDVVDVWEQPVRARELSAMEMPTTVLFVNGRERARLAGRHTRRQVLRKFLPYLYPDPDEALARLREQLHSDNDAFPSRRKGAFQARPRSSKVEALAEATLFGDLNRRELHRVARFADEVPVCTGQVVAEQDRTGDEFVLIVEGEMEVRRNGRKLATLGPGDSVGEMSLLDGEPRSATVTATGDGETLVIHRTDFTYLLDSVPGLARKLLATLSRRLREADRKLVG